MPVLQRVAKGHLLDAKRCPFGGRNVPFWKAKGHVLQDGPAGRMPRRAVVGLHAGMQSPLIRISGVVMQPAFCFMSGLFPLDFSQA